MKNFDKHYNNSIFALHTFPRMFAHFNKPLSLFSIFLASYKEISGS